MIFRRLLRLVGVLVLLVYDYHSELFKGSKYGRTSTDTNVGTAASYLSPGVVSLSCRKTRVPYGNSVTVEGTEGSDGLRSERNFGYEHDHLAA